MMRYVPTSSLSVAETLSRDLWQIARPLAVRMPGEVTDLWCGIHEHEGKTWMVVDTEDSVPVHATATLSTAVRDILSAAGIADATLDALAGLIVQQRGGRLQLWDYFPQAFKDASKTRTEMITAGWLAEPDVN